MTERVTLITGASSGIGADLARVFASNGHRVALVARRSARLTALAAEIAGAGGAAPVVIPCDLRRADAKLNREHHQRSSDDREWAPRQSQYRHSSTSSATVSAEQSSRSGPMRPSRGFTNGGPSKTT